MRSTNKLYLRGYVGNEPKLFDKICKVSVGTNRSWTDKKGKAHDETDWVQVTILNEKVAKWVAENLKKGDPVFCEARVRQNAYRNKDDEMVYSTDVIATLFDSLKQKATDDAADDTAE